MSIKSWNNARLCAGKEKVVSPFPTISQHSLFHLSRAALVPASDSRQFVADEHIRSGKSFTHALTYLLRVPPERILNLLLRVIFPKPQ